MISAQIPVNSSPVLLFDSFLWFLMLGRLKTSTLVIFSHQQQWRKDQFTMDGTRNLGVVGGDGEGKLTAKEEECLVADAGARSQGAMAGSAVAAGLGVPAAMSVPYVGWLAAGWVSLLGNNIGSSAGSLVNSVISDC